MKPYYTLVLLAMLLPISNCVAQENIETESIDQDPVEMLLSKMTLEEKIGQMNQYSSFYDVTGPAPDTGNNKQKYEQIKNGLVGSMLNVNGVKNVRAMQKLAVENSRLGIPLIFGFDVIHGHKTIFPIPLAEAASWDLEAIENSAQIAATEASAMGINWTFAPMVDISRDARWGRVMEGAGEDPYLGARIAAARVHGFQGEDLSDPHTIAACAKHFAGYGFSESGKEYNTVDFGTSTLYNMVLPPFKAANDAKVATFMNAFNVLNGIPATASSFLQRDILKREWGFEGFVVTDWETITEMTDHGFAKNNKIASKYAIIAGADMDMESYAYIKHLKELVENNEIDESLITDAARRILHVKQQLGLLDDPYKYCNTKREKELIYHKDHLDAALDMAKKSIVLLKNENGLLPLPKSGQKIAVIGHLAASKNSPLGSWRLGAESHSAVSVLEGLNAYSDNIITYEQGVQLFNGEENFIYELEINTTDRTGMDKATQLASNSDIVILVLGEHCFQSGEARSRTDIGLPGLQQELMEKIYAVNKNIVLVLMNGRPLAIPWADQHIPAIVETWQLGTQSGHAIAQVLYGDYNPSGKLPISFPRSVGQVPIYYNHKSTGRALNEGMIFWSHYTDEANDPLYPFGYGLSYSKFEYSDLKIKGRKVTVKVKNTSKVDGEEVVQLYIKDKFASVTRPVKELKGFEKILISSGEEKSVTFTLTDDKLGFYNNKGQFIVESGDFDIMIGGNSKEILTKNFTLTK